MSITFISPLYEGFISDKEIVARREGGSLMADRGFTIQEELKPLKVRLNITAFLSGRDQLTEAEMKESQGIHVERVISISLIVRHMP